VTDGQKDRRTDGRMDGRTDGQGNNNMFPPEREDINTVSDINSFAKVNTVKRKHFFSNFLFTAKQV